MRIILLTISLLLVFWGKSLGCSCNFPTEIPKAYQVTNTILKVKVLDKSIVSFRSTMNQDSLQIYESNNLDAEQRDWLQAEFVIKVVAHVSEVFKGNVNNDTIIIYTTKTGASCGYTSFFVNDEYLIYASPKSYAYHLFYPPSKGKVLEKEGTLWTEICTLTGEFNEKHAIELRGIRNLQVEKQAEHLLIEKSVKILNNSNLLKHEKDYIYIKYVEDLEEWKQICYTVKENSFRVIIVPQKIDVVIRNIQTSESKAIVAFKSFGSGDYEYLGEVNFILENNNWVFERINFITQIE